MIKIKLKGKIPSKKNTWLRNRWGNVYQSKQKEIDDLIWQTKTQIKKIKNLPIEKKQRVKISIWGDLKNDLDNQISTILDILEKAGVIKNDKLITFIEAKKLHSKSERAVVELKNFFKEETKICPTCKKKFKTKYDKIYCCDACKPGHSKYREIYGKK